MTSAYRAPDGCGAAPGAALDGVPATAGIRLPAAIDLALEALGSARRTLVDHADEKARPVIDAIDRFLAGEDFAAALGMAGGWHSAFRQRERERALRMLEANYFCGLSGWPLAHALTAAASAYESGGWPQDRAARRRPSGMNGYLYDIFCVSKMPGEETLRRRVASG